jgi:hypothetical protein
LVLQDEEAWRRPEAAPGGEAKPSCCNMILRMKKQKRRGKHFENILKTKTK